MNGLEHVALKKVIPHWIGFPVYVGSEDKRGYVSIKPATLKAQGSNGYCIVHYEDSVDAVHPEMIFILDPRTIDEVDNYNLRIAA